jgi:hypothetical protein
MAARPVSISEALVDPNMDDKYTKKVDVSGESVPLDEKFASNPFIDPKIADHYRRLYEASKYECRHAFDPDLEWEPEEEKKLVRKLDWHVCLLACVMFFALQVDRGNLSQAVSDNMLDQLGLNTNEFNFGKSVSPFLVTAASYKGAVTQWT